MLVHTSKGQQIIEKMKVDNVLMREVQTNDYLKYNHNLSKKIIMSQNHSNLGDDYR